MINRSILSVSLISFTLLLAGCGTSPNANLYILNAMHTDTSRSAVTIEGHNIAVKVGPVSIPETLDQTLIVSRSGSNMLIQDEFNRWGGDFQSDIQGVLGENISLLLPTDKVILSQEITLIPIDFQVVINIRQFDGQLGDRVTLNADWSVADKRNEKSVMAKKSVLYENTDGAEYQDYVAAQSRLLEKLSKEIADEIRRQLTK